MKWTNTDSGRASIWTAHTIGDHLHDAVAQVACLEVLRHIIIAATVMYLVKTRWMGVERGSRAVMLQPRSTSS